MNSDGELYSPPEGNDDASGQRLASGSSSAMDTWQFWGPNGIQVTMFLGNAKLTCGDYVHGFSSGFCIYNASSDYLQHDKLYFAGRLVFQEDAVTVTDRLGTVVQESNHVRSEGSSLKNFEYFPYEGTAYSGVSPEVTFATYEATPSGLLYAKNRYYDPARGRFTTPDPAASGTIARPNSWNRYAYTEGDPVNFNDPEGLFIANPWYQTGQNWMSFSLFWGSMLPGPVHQPILGLDGPGSGGGGGGHASILSKSGALVALTDKLNNLGTNCLKVMGGNVSQLQSAAKTINFYDGRTDSGWTDQAGGGEHVTFAQYFSSYPSVAAITLNNAKGTPTANVVLGPDFFGNVAGGHSNPYAEQQQELFHEFFHVDMKLGDKEAVMDYHISVAVGQSASSALDAWLSHDCSNKK